MLFPTVLEPRAFPWAIGFDTFGVGSRPFRPWMLFPTVLDPRAFPWAIGFDAFGVG
jgi:hypothetical protein